MKTSVVTTSLPVVTVAPIRMITAPHGLDSYSAALAGNAAAPRACLRHPIFVDHEMRQDEGHLRWSDAELLNLHRTKQLAAAVDYQGPLDASRLVKLDNTKRSELETEALESILGERCRLTPYLYMQVPRQLEELRDRLYYLCLATKDQAAVVGDIDECDYNINRSVSTMAFYDSAKMLVALLPDCKFEGLFPSRRAEPETSRPEVEVASLVREGSVNVLDAGIGRSTTIDLVARRLHEFGRDVKTYGIGLTDLAGGLQLTAPAFVGRFEDYDFPTQFDLIYSQVGSSFYTPNVPRYAAKLRSILRPGGAALLDIYHYSDWEEALRLQGIKHKPLYSVSKLAWAEFYEKENARLDSGEDIPDPLDYMAPMRTGPETLAMLRKPTGLLIRKD